MGPRKNKMEYASLDAIIAGREGFPRARGRMILRERPPAPKGDSQPTRLR